MHHKLTGQNAVCSLVVFLADLSVAPCTIIHDASSLQVQLTLQGACARLSSCRTWTHQQEQVKLLMHKAGCIHLQSAQLSTASHKIAMLTLTHVAHIILERQTYAGRGTGARHRRSLDSIGPAPPGELRAIAAWPDRHVVQIWLVGSLDRGSICLRKPLMHLCRSCLL